MILFATIATGIVEFIHKISGTRAKHLKRALGYLFENIIWERVGHRLPRDGGEKDPAAKARHSENFVTALTTNPVAVLRNEANLSQSENGNEIEDLDASDFSKVKRAFPAREIEYLTPHSFAERLARTETGKAILDEGEEFIDELVTDFVRTFDRLGRAATDFVGARARLLSVVVGIALAFAANIDASRLVTTLVDDPVLRRGLIAQGEAAAEANQKAEEQLQAVAQAAENETLDEEVANALKTAVDNLKVQLGELEGRGIPIGYDEYPWKGFWECDSTQLPCWLEAPGELLRWIVMCLLSGVLIGLGGPFWYEVFRRLSQAIQIARSFGLGAAKKSEKSDEAKEAGQPSAPADPTVPINPIDAFRTAVKIHHSKTPENPPSGDPYEQGRRARKAGMAYAQRRSAPKPQTT